MPNGSTSFNKTARICLKQKRLKMREFRDKLESALGARDPASRINSLETYFGDL
jgi:hypothetical protein